MKSKTRARMGTRALVVALGATLGLAVAGSPALAKNEFENAFEDQIGRFLAYEAYRVGRSVLTGVNPYQPGYREPVYGGYRDYHRPVQYRRHARERWDEERRWRERHRDRYEEPCRADHDHRHHHGHDAAYEYERVTKKRDRDGYEYERIVRRKKKKKYDDDDDDDYWEDHRRDRRGRVSWRY